MALFHDWLRALARALQGGLVAGFVLVAVLAAVQALSATALAAPAQRPAMATVAEPEPTLWLDARTLRLPAWPSARVFFAPTTAGHTPEQLLARPDWFAPTNLPLANLGVRSDVVWARWHLRLAAEAPDDWLLDVDHPTLDRLDVYLAADGQIIGHWQTGDSLPLAERPLPYRTLAVPLALQPGRDYQLLIRAQNDGTLLLPVVLHRPQAYAVSEHRVQLVQGVLAGIGLCLLAYTLLQFANTRDALFAHYALTLLGVTGFFLAFHGLAAQHLWPGEVWLIQKTTMLFAQFGLVGAFLFADSVLRMPLLNPRRSRLMRGLAGLSALVMLTYLVGLLPYRMAHAYTSLGGVLPVVLALPEALRLARRGDLGARYMLIGWTVYGLGVASFALLLRGQIPVHPWVVHAFQASAVFEMLMWMAVVGARAGETRDAARWADQQRLAAQREGERLASLALSDPLTGLANRRGLVQQAEPLLQRAYKGWPVAVLMLDLDGFKRVNDVHGHELGDQLLCAVATRLRDSVRAGDVVARLGGDEFVVVLAGVRAREAHRIARAMSTALAAPYSLSGRTLKVGATTGYALAPDHGRDLTVLLRTADAAMYQGKAQGRGLVVRAAAQRTEADAMPV